MTSCTKQSKQRWGRIIDVAVAYLMLLVVPAVLTAQAPPSVLLEERVPIVVLDAGRGGSNAGAQGPTGLLEKDLTLQVASATGKLVEELLGIRVVLTRTDDSEVSREARAALANEAAGDLFISIHAGGSLAPTRREFQTFYFDAGPQGLPSVREPSDDADAPDPTAPGQRGAGGRPLVVQWDQAQLDYLDASQMLARILQRNLRTQVAEDGRGVFGLPILLLRWVRMPAVLLDLGSLGDAGFDAKLHDEVYLQRVALGITQAINDYLALQR